MSIQIDGREYEVSSYGEPFDDGSRGATLRLVKQEPKYLVALTKGTQIGWHINLDLANISEPQSQLMKEAVEALMEYITDPTISFHKSGVEKKAYRAWKSMRENN